MGIVTSALPRTTTSSEHGDVKLGSCFSSSHCRYEFRSFTNSNSEDTFTISNQGGIGGAHFTPIVNKPEVAILGLGKGAMKPVVRDGKVEPRLLLPLTISYDHRVIDGGNAARFAVDLVQAIETLDEGMLK